MAQKENDFLKKLLATFKVEAEEHLQAITSGLLELEKTPAAERKIQIVESVFREVHSLKGAARAVNNSEIEAVCQSLEGVFAALKRKELAPSPELCDLLHPVVDALGQLLLSGEENREAAEESQLTKLIQRLEEASKGVLPRAKAPPISDPTLAIAQQDQPIPALPSATIDTVRISTRKLDSLLLQAEELLTSKLALVRRAAELGEVNAVIAAWKKDWAKIKGRVSNGRVRQSEVQALREFAELNDQALASIEIKLAGVKKLADLDQRTLGRMVDDLLAEMKGLAMLPFSWVLEIFPRFVRDLSRDQGKEAELLIEGGEIEIDRRILEEIKDPLLHLARNCVDHGIENPAERRRKKKPPRGTVRIRISQKDGNKVEVFIADDGAGIDIAKVRSAALRLGVVSRDEAEKLNEQETLSLIFQSGISTSPMLTDISGRGLGLAIVREKIEKLGGVVSVQSEPDIATSFRLVLPLALATFRGILVRVNEHFFILPLTSVELTLRVKRESIRTAGSRETIELNRLVVPLIRLGDTLELPRKRATGDSTDAVPALVLGLAEKRIAFAVDEILNEQEVLVKTLGKQLSRVRNIAGATVLGSGQVVPVVNVSDLMKSAVRLSARPIKQAAATGDDEEAEKKSVLVVEDSITARALVKNILEAAGYTVATAVDGIDGFTQLRSHEFDIVISDVDMPRMNGFDLTAKIRADKKLSGVPVVLVTALESRDDRERGIDSGANAYIVKSNFDQSNLLEVIRRLI
jgi:two-component system chemotaxis sensor kinase CheA